MVIENTFGIVKKRFRQLFRIEIRDVDRITKFILACCVLHNICVDSNDAYDDLEDSDDEDNDESGVFSGEEIVEDDDEDEPTERQLRQQGVIKRNVLTNLFR